MENFLFRPINRKTYFIGLLVLLLVNFLFSLPKSFSRGDENINMIFMIFSLFLGIIAILWDYKRIIDISSNKKYLFFLIIPVLSMLPLFFTNQDLGVNPFLSNQNPNMSSLSYILLIFAVISLISLVYKLFLIFKKGYPKTPLDTNNVVNQ
jgi:uncharacterized membrane protein YhaH (DUF805 family)